MFRKTKHLQKAQPTCYTLRHDNISKPFYTCVVYDLLQCLQEKILFIVQAFFQNFEKLQKYMTHAPWKAVLMHLQVFSQVSLCTLHRLTWVNIFFLFCQEKISLCSMTIPPSDPVGCLTQCILWVQSHGLSCIITWIYSQSFSCDW